MPENTPATETTDPAAPVTVNAESPQKIEATPASETVTVALPSENDPAEITGGAPVATEPDLTRPGPEGQRVQRYGEIRRLLVGALTRSSPPAAFPPVLGERMLRLIELRSGSDLEGWIVIAIEVHGLVAACFSTMSPADQTHSANLQKLGESIDGMRIIATLAQRAEASGGALDDATFDNIADGSQTKELTALGIKPHDLIPLINLVEDARRLIPAKPPLA